VNEANIKRISTEYKNSAQERKDIFTAYKKSRGNLDKIYESVMLSDILEDDERFRKIIDEGIEQGLLESYPIYERDNNDAAREKIKAAERKRRENWDKKHGGVTEATEKAKAKQNSKAKKGGAGGTGGLADLQALIQGRQRARMGGFDSVVDRLEEKYAAKSRSKKRATPMDTEPSEEEFLAAQKKLNMGKKSSRSTKKVAQDYEDEDEAEEDVDLESEEVEEVTPPPKAKRRGRATRTGGRAKTKA
jgi:DnaJ family protein C protein 9